MQKPIRLSLKSQYAQHHDKQFHISSMKVLVCPLSEVVHFVKCVSADLYLKNEVDIRGLLNLEVVWLLEYENSTERPKQKKTHKHMHTKQKTHTYHISVP